MQIGFLCPLLFETINSHQHVTHIRTPIFEKTSRLHQNLWFFFFFIRQGIAVAQVTVNVFVIFRVQNF